MSLITFLIRYKSSLIVKFIYISTIKLASISLQTTYFYSKTNQTNILGCYTNIIKTAFFTNIDLLRLHL